MKEHTLREIILLIVAIFSMGLASIASITYFDVKSNVIRLQNENSRLVDEYNELIKGE